MDWFERIPKAEIHLHLEGSIPLEALWQLMEKYGGDPSVPDLAALERRFEYRDFPHFIETWLWKNEFLREYEDFTWISEAVARDLAQQNIRYAEVFYSPPDFGHHGLETVQLTEAIRQGLSRVPEMEVALVADLVRNYGPEQGALTLAEVTEAREFGVIGIGIGGAEQQCPPEPFAAIFAEARRLGFHTSAHAGEAAGAASVWGAVRALEVDRIGHGTRAEEDPALLDHLAEHQIPIEMCPLSNVCTGVTSSIDEHPVRRYFERGLLITVNTDDPKMFGNSLAEELRLLEKRFSFSRDEVRKVVLNGLRASWLPASRKEKMIEQFRADPAWEAQS